MIHQYKLNGYNIVLDVYSGSVHSVDDVAYDIIAMFEDTPADEIVARIREKYPSVPKADIRECLQDIESLKAAGKLFTSDAFADRAPAFKAKTSVLKALCLHVAHSCNLACSYCFAGQGEYSGENALMSYDVGKRAMDFLVENSGARTHLEVDFFGGEPLLNWDVVKRLVAYGRELEKTTDKHFRFTLTTNGVLLDDEVTDFCNKEMYNVVLSLDGRKEVHDRYRVDRAGKGSYDRIVPAFQSFIQARGDREYYVRGTFSRFNTDFLRDILHMTDLGFDKLSMEPVVSKPDEPWALQEDDLPVVYKQYEELATLMLEREKEGRPFTFYHYMIDLKNGPCIYKRISGCGSGTEYLAVTPQGELYPCHQFVGDPRFLMGSIYEGVTNTALQEEFQGCSVYAREGCKDCWAKLYCAGGCAANAYHTTGSLTGIYEYGCKLFRKRIECAIMRKVAQAEEE
ncbi:MAG: thioether cross-link-forming SCIFF peptide maturase [Clostridia bacterium]|nr:thioether cross-link-forming SCIFF peptide maturase [Clostridia bacterium]